ncbi:hypothetical protein NUU61_004147 [Penicillium alfredii]|uniref:F-box domain-containing protein n=1 Tax=Penicillium alfredii TaxID=1506179 RepID=A0A9W9KD06_9EURO|nr:uncharacterized protein NUU61_004147 [Penicillium alfredii]KAJ5101925.1 hypothetical protein NUU61_004147 [Penicillium alfredii]
MAAVNRNMFDASIATERPGGSSLMVMPLNLIAQIVSNVEDTGDLARLCRTCRVLNYMALPQLYRSLTLTSYDKIRYRGEEPEGIGRASPFTMGLNAIITRPYASLVRSIGLRGDWKEHELEEHARVGRVPDSSMLLNIAARAAVDRMTNLESFSWELNTKMLDTVYTGLAQLPKLTSLTIRFPSSRHPQPTFVLPGMPHLRCLKVTDIDPLCYPDDIATMLWKSKKLRDLKLHWSPRMRIAQEPSVSVHDYFRKCIAAKQPLAVKKLSFQNMYAFHTEEFNIAFDPSTVEEVTFLNGAEGANTFIESSWPTIPPQKRLRIKSARMDALSKRNSEFLGNFSGLDRLYFVNATTDWNDYLNSPRPGIGPGSSALTPPTPENPPYGGPGATSGSSPMASASPASQVNLTLNMRDSYLANITTSHGSTLRHLLLSSRWPLSTSLVARLHGITGAVRPFPAETRGTSSLIPVGPAAAQGGPANAAALRASKSAYGQGPGAPSESIREALANARSLAEVVDMDDQVLMDMMSYDLANKQVYGNVKIIGMGWKAFELRDFYKAPIPSTQNGSESQSSTPAVDRATEAPDSTSPTNGVGPGEPDRSVASQPVSPDLNGTNSSRLTPNPPGLDPAAIPSLRQPPSTLGKRTRDQDDSESTPRAPARYTEGPESPQSREPNLAVQGCYGQTLTGDGQVWRRRMRRVGWEVLQNWEVWALDSQEI